MSNVFWYPESIKSRVLSDVLNWKTSEKSYEDLCERFGNASLLTTSHQRLFNRFLKETRELEGAQTNINEIMFNESMFLRYRILLDVISGVPTDKSYITLRETMEDISYPEFEFWYYRFYNGQRELDYDRSKDPKPLTFSDLPIDVIEKIIEVSELKPRYILRRVSHSLQRLVDSCKLVIGNITFNGESCPISVIVDDIKTTFHCQNCTRSRCPVGSVGHLTSEACRHLSTFIRNPKLQLGTLHLNIYQFIEDNNLVDELFKSTTHQFHVRSLKLQITNDQNLMNFIYCIKPKVLKEIDIRCDYMDSVDIHTLVESQQWKNAEKITIDCPISCDVTHFFHLKIFDICLERISLETILKLRDGISKCSIFEWCSIRAEGSWFSAEVNLDWPDEEKIQNALELKEQVIDEMEYFVFNIPNSTDSLAFSFSEQEEIFIEKCNCFISS